MFRLKSFNLIYFTLIIFYFYLPNIKQFQQIKQMEISTNIEVLNLQIKQLFNQYVEQENLSNSLNVHIQSMLIQKQKNLLYQEQLNLHFYQQTDQKLKQTSEHLLQDYLRIVNQIYQFQQNHSSIMQARLSKETIINQEEILKKQSKNKNKKSASQKQQQQSRCVDPSLELQLKASQKMILNYQQYYQKQKQQSELHINFQVQAIKDMRIKTQNQELRTSDLQAQQIQLCNKKYTYESIIKQKQNIIKQQQLQEYNLSIQVAELRAKQEYCIKLLFLQSQKGQQLKKQEQLIMEKLSEVKDKVKDSKLLSKELKDRIEDKNDQKIKKQKLIQIIKESLRQMCYLTKNMDMKFQIQSGCSDK